VAVFAGPTDQNRIAMALNSMRQLANKEDVQEVLDCQLLVAARGFVSERDSEAAANGCLEDGQIFLF